MSYEFRYPAFAIDVEAVILTTGHPGLARVAVVDDREKSVLDLVVRPETFVRNYLTHLTGLTQRDYSMGVNKETAIKAVKEVIASASVLVFHDPTLELKLLELETASYDNIFDTSASVVLMDMAGVVRKRGDRVKLKILSENILGESIQVGYHSPVEDARAAMRLFKRTFLYLDQ